MARVFISYSRQDKAFVEQLYRALADSGREAWVDWEGIPPSAQWLNEIYSAIDAVETFIFVLSPDSVASEVCGLEAAHAIASRKRIIPLICADVSAGAVRQREALAPLAELNWISFRPTDNFPAAFEKLAFALDTDLDYWHKASDLLVQARKWEAQRRNASLTLRGNALADAERWLVEGATKQPTPTKLQTEFINVSRRAANRRQRTTLSILSVVSVVLLILTLISYYFSQVAQAQTTAAVARQLAAQANVALAHNAPDVALLLAAHAVQTQETAVTRDALLSAVTDNPH